MQSDWCLLFLTVDLISQLIHGLNELYTTGAYLQGVTHSESALMAGAVFVCTGGLMVVIEMDCKVFLHKISGLIDECC